ncbi:hypothetical protein OPQ81_002734 [Rhizoctonia solani]|nr:hypothetical protein OPQ81_002734 [Rhizoctonia solani]
MISSGANYLGLYGQSPRHAAALYTDARDSLRQASSTSAAAKRRSMQPASPASSTSSCDTGFRPPRDVPRSTTTPRASFQLENNINTIPADLTHAKATQLRDDQGHRNAHLSRKIDSGLNFGTYPVVPPFQIGVHM